MIRHALLACTITALSVTTSSAQQIQNDQVKQSLGQQTSVVSDDLFAAAAASGGMAELNISQLGSQKATDPGLKKFSQMMIDDHTRLNQELMATARSRNITLPQAPDARALFCAESLAGLSGEVFDRCYAKAQFMVHLDAVATFEAESQRGQDSEMKALASKTLPKIKKHLEIIRPIAMKYEKAEKSVDIEKPEPRD